MSYDTERKRAGRIPFVYIEAMLDRCTKTFGVGDCHAVGEPCYNTRVSCKYTPAYTIERIAYRFCMKTPVVPVGLRAIPCLDSISLAPAKVDPGKGLGTRAAVTANLSDFNHSDYGVDPYVASRSYDPMTQGTYFGRLRARNPYYNGRELFVYSGYLEEDGSYKPENFQKRTYFLDQWAGPSARGAVSLEGKDILKLADDDRSVAPVPSKGKLSGAITNADTSLTLAPAGIGVLYPASGTVRIGSELMTFTRSSDTMTLTRGQFNTTAASHNSGDTVQLCLVISALTVQDIIYLLLTDYAGVDPIYINKTAWDAEQTAFLPRLYSAVIATPTGVNKMITELCEQVGVMLVWDEVNSLLLFQAIRPNEDEVIKNLSKGFNLISGSIDVKDLADQRVNEVVVFYGQRDPTKSLDDETNYSNTGIGSNIEDQSEAQSNDIRSKVIYSRWISSINGPAADDLAARYIERYKRAPREATFSVDAKDSDIGMLSFVEIQADQTQDVTGQPEPLLLQVIERKEVVPGTVWGYTAREFAFSTASDRTHFVKIRSYMESVNIRTYHDTIYSPAKAGDTVYCIVFADVLVTGANTSDYALRTGTFATGVILKILILGTVAGRGGNGGQGSDVYTPSAAGQNGGPGFLAEYPAEVDNQGEIGGGGGGGGGGGMDAFLDLWGGDFWISGGGGGGGGWPLGLGGIGGDVGVEDFWTRNGDSGGDADSTSAGGAGDGKAVGPINAGDGGAGGKWAAGSAGHDSNKTNGANTTFQQGKAGGSQGAAVAGNSYITWVNMGTIHGSIS